MVHVLAQATSPDDSQVAIVEGILLLIWLFLGIGTVAGRWAIFKKAGQPGWPAIVPFYKLYVQMKVVGRPWWWFIMCYTPFVSLVFLIITLMDLSKSFGKDVLNTVGLAVVPFVFYPIFGFGSARYLGPAAAFERAPGGYGGYGGWPPPTYPVPPSSYPPPPAGPGARSAPGYAPPGSYSGYRPPPSGQWRPPDR